MGDAIRAGDMPAQEMAFSTCTAKQGERAQGCKAEHARDMARGPVPEFARQGRQNQRYAETGERLVAGCIPLRRGEGDQVEVMVITSRGGKGWVFPKGGWEVDEDSCTAAKRETVEEAGVRGELGEQPIGVFHFHSGKQERRQQADKGRCIAHIYAMNVDEELAVWPESRERKRKWCSVQEAADMLRHAWMKEALAEWARQNGLTVVLPAPP
ncbi:unnamed protein product [Pedinophyceae sp. YPF-701]|nr:unnamed protein product [Pedinophyceae sp. YPF-701]